MNNIYLLQVTCMLDEEAHYENVYSSKIKAIKEGKEYLDKLLRRQYEDWFEEDSNIEIPKLTHEQLFQLKVIYDFSITVFNPQFVDSLDDIKNLQEVKEWDIYDEFVADLKPAKISYNYDYNGKIEYISGIYFYKYNGKKMKLEVTMKYKDYINKKAGAKFKAGDIVKIKKTKDSHKDYIYGDKLHVIIDTPHKKENQKFFTNNYYVIVNHSLYDEGCHIDTFKEDELELYKGNLSKESPIMFLSKYFKGEIELKDIEWSDIECGRIVLNEHKSFRDIPEIMKE